MGIHKLKTKLEKDTKGLLSKVVLTSNNITKVYIPEKDKVHYAVIDINILAMSVGNTDIDIWIMPADKSLPEMVDLIEFKLIFAQNSVYVRTNIEIGEGECLAMKSSEDNVVVRITGHEDRTP